MVHRAGQAREAKSKGLGATHPSRVWEVLLGRPQVSFAKRQREQAKRERQQLKAEKRAQRKTGEEGPDDDIDMDELVAETPIVETPVSENP
jgi:hypothetical protein